MKIAVYDEVNGSAELEAHELAGQSPVHLQAGERVAGVSGKAFDLKSWHRAWSDSRQRGVYRTPSHLQVEAVDEFQATVPWAELDRAMFLYAQENGEPLKKGFPLRLYVPDGSSECLNVKSVVKIRIIYDGSRDMTATYGFKNVVTLEQLRKPAGS